MGQVSFTIQWTLNLLDCLRKRNWLEYIQKWKYPNFQYSVFFTYLSQQSEYNQNFSYIQIFTCLKQGNKYIWQVCHCLCQCVCLFVCVCVCVCLFVCVCIWCTAVLFGSEVSKSLETKYWRVQCDSNQIWLVFLSMTQVYFLMLMYWRVLERNVC